MIINGIALKVDDQLSALGLKLHDLEVVIKTGFLAMANCTENDAPCVPGIFRWAHMVRAIREILLLQGWERLDYRNSPLTVNFTLNIAVMISTGDENTGLSFANPRTKNPKGKNTRLAIKNNAQLDFFPETLVKVPENGFAGQTWILLVYVAGSEIRAELSLPSQMDDFGNVLEWKDRIILPPIAVDTIEPNEPEVPEYAPIPEIEITRRPDCVDED